MNSQFILNYTGQKFKETKELNSIDFSKYKTIVECFGGSFGFSRYLYEIKGLKDIQYIIYDNDKDLIDFYNYIKDLLLNDKFEDFINEYNSKMVYIKKQFPYKDHASFIDNKKTKEYIQNIENKHLKFMMMKNIFRGGMSTISDKRNLKFLDMIKQTTFIHNEFNKEDLIEYNKDDTLFYLDPPYLLEDNTAYSNTLDMKHFYEDILYLFENKNVMFIHSYNYLLNYVFGKYKLMEYQKTYAGSRKVVPHYVYTSF
tara:strand:+ start:473 stop:1240 length:768 start_codon:yes stop_codon:yes gene_type:complete